MQTLTTDNLNELRKQVQKLKKDNPQEQIAVLSQDEEFNRKALEIKIDFLIINEEQDKKDYSKQRNSDLNEVLAKLAEKNSISIAIDLDKIIKKNNVEQAKSLARLKQNIMLSKKAGTKIVFLTKSRKKQELQAILISLGASTKQASDALFFN